MSSIYASDNGTWNQSDLCDIAQRISGQALFVPLLIAGAILGFLSVAPNLLLVWATLKTKVYPANLRFLMAHLSINLTCYALTLAVKYVQFLATDPCDMAINALECRIKDLGYLIPWYNIVYSLMGICWERLYCSINYRTYDKPASRPWLALAICAAIWTGALTVSLYQIPMLNPTKIISICDTQFTSASDTFGLTTMLTNASLEVISGVIIVILSVYDKKKLKASGINRAQFTLAERFQLNQCVQVNAMLAPSVILHAACYIPSIVSLLLSRYGIAISTEVRWIWSAVINVYKLMYTLAHPALTFNRNVHLRKKIQNSKAYVGLAALLKPGKALSGGKVANVTSQSRTMENHFNVMENMWVQAERGMRDKK